ncbi:hypothetical protein [Kitasatospora sp. NPDC058218]|uniref:hypothetical protein n=1 Tax=Kitasatospora sp. NPDC058218 TaxID=3346385 RepID=UPI0036DF8361
MRMRLVAGLVVVVAAVSGCGGAAVTTASPPAVGPPSVGQPSAGPSEVSPVADCILSITPWLQASLDGGTDLGDYQEMGLSSAQGGALRELQRQAAALRAQGPLPYGWVTTEVKRACVAIAEARATMTEKPTGWP